MNRWWVLIFLFFALTFTSLSATAQVTAADDRASQFVIGEVGETESYGTGLGATLLAAGSLLIMGTLLTLALSARRYNKTRAAAAVIVRRIPSVEEDF